MKLKKLVHQHTCSILFSKAVIYIILVHWEMLQHLNLEIMFSSTPFLYISYRMEQAGQEDTAIKSHVVF